MITLLILGALLIGFLLYVANEAMKDERELYRRINDRNQFLN